jgi:hypothetical protein
MPNSVALIVALATLGWFSVVTCAEPVTSKAILKDTQCRQSACATKCDAKGEKCLVTCDDKQTGDKCKNGFYRVSPFGVLEVRPQQKSP